MDKKKTWKRCVSVLLSLVICLSLMAPTLGESTSSSSDSEEVETTTVVTAATETADSSDAEEEESEDVITLSDETEDVSTEIEDNTADEDTTEYGLDLDEIETLVESESVPTDDAIENGNSTVIYSVNYDSIPETNMYYVTPDATLEDMIALLPQEIEVTMTDGSAQSIPIGWRVNEDDWTEYEENIDSGEDSFIRFNVDNGQSLVRDQTADMTTHRLFTISGTGYVAFCASHGDASPDTSVTYTWNGMYTSDEISAILEQKQFLCSYRQKNETAWLCFQMPRCAVQQRKLCWQF